MTIADLRFEWEDYSFKRFIRDWIQEIKRWIQKIKQARTLKKKSTGKFGFKSRPPHQYFGK